jgi:hypothetical protein
MICFAIAQRQGPYGDLIRERWPFDQRQHQPARIFRVDDSVNGADVGVVERSQNLGFTLEASHALGIAKEGRGEDFEGDVALERGIAGFVDLAHPAFPKQ